MFPFEGSSAKVWDLALPPTESCSEGSLVYQVTGFLISMDLSYRIEAYQQRATVTGSQGISTQASEGDAVSAIQESKGKSKWSRSKQYVSLLSAGLLLVVLLSLGTGVALWVRRSRSAAGTANSSTAAGNCPLACAAGMVPKVCCPFTVPVSRVQPDQRDAGSQITPHDLYLERQRVAGNMQLLSGLAGAVQAGQ